jgi:hypothetical protein
MIIRFDRTRIAIDSQHLSPEGEGGLIPMMAVRDNELTVPEGGMDLGEGVSFL